MDADTYVDTDTNTTNNNDARTPTHNNDANVIGNAATNPSNPSNQY